ncbi:MAG TPA: hypothetical protein VGL86_20350 [Polyangia bacterium]
MRAALETLAELVIAHGVMDARTLESIVGDLIAPPMVAKALSAPLPPPAPSAAEALLRGPLPKPSPVKPAAVAAKPAPAPARAPTPAPRPVAAKPAPAPVAVNPAPAPIAQPVVQQPAPVAQVQPIQVQPAPVAVQPMPQPAPVAVQPIAQPAPSPEPIVPPSSVQPVVASPFPSEPAPSAMPARKNPFDAHDAAQLEAELTETPPSLAPKGGFFSRIFGRPKTSPAAVAANAASIEFTERVPKLPVEGLYAEQQRATELSFPPTAPAQRKPRAAGAAAPRKARPVDAAPARFCDRCWRRMDASGTCKTCSPSVSA